MILEKIIAPSAQKKKCCYGAAFLLVRIRFIPAFFHEINPKLG